MLQAQQIVALACQICQCPGRLTQAGQLLNLILQHYSLTIDMDTVRLDAQLNISPQAQIPYFYQLQANYLRMYDIYYNVQGTVFRPEQFELKELDSEYTATGVNNYPEWWATDVSKSPPVIAFYPPPSVPLTIFYRYRPSSLDITTPESSVQIPYYPDQLTLLKELCVQLGDVAGGDDRSARWENEIARRMRKYFDMMDDKEGFSATVALDARFFRRNVNLPPSKVLGF